MLLSIPVNTTSKMIEFPIYDSSSSVGSTLAGLVYNSTTLTAYYNRDGASGASVAISLGTMTKGTWTSSGFVAVDGTNMPGWYQLGLPNAAIAIGAQYVSVMLKGATNMVPASFILELTATSNQDSVRGGMTALPNAAADAAGGLIISDAGGLDVDAKLANTNQVTATRMSVLTDWENGGRLDAILDLTATASALTALSGSLATASEIASTTLNASGLTAIETAIGDGIIQGTLTRRNYEKSIVAGMTTPPAGA
jgi:hypothetical protein